MSSKRKSGEKRSKAKRSSGGNSDGENAVNVQVVVRCRPLNKEEKKTQQPLALCCDALRSEVRIANASKHLSRTFTFDRVYSSHASQEDVYENTMTSIIEEVLQGFNCTVFAYGQTGSGKTFTMEGGRNKSGHAAWQGPKRGIIPRAIEHIFQHLGNIHSEYTVRVSQLELYNEELFDLLSPLPPGCGDEPSLRIFDEVGLSGQRTTRVSNLEEVVVKSAADIFKILETSTDRRRVAETKMNKYSSRSHCIFSITIHVKERNCEGEDMLKVGKLNLVDLAGSENIGRSGAVDDRRREAGLINQSLLTLGRVINALVDHHSHVPYRESKLTRLLQESLGGSAKTCVIATVSPAGSNLEESLSTLDYAARAKNIKNKPQQNQKFTKSALIKEYVEELEALKAELYAARSKDGAVYLPQERYDSMVTELESQSNQVVELESAIAEKTNALDRLRANFDRQLAEINQLSSSLRSTRTELSSTHSQLSRATTDLHQVSQSLEEERRVVQEHEIVLDVLQSHAKEMVSTIDVTVQDIDGLHAKIERKTAAQNKSETNVLQHQRRVDASLQTFQQSVNELFQRQSDHLATIESRFGSFVQENDARVHQLESELRQTNRGLREQCSVIREEVQQTRGDVLGCLETAHAQLQLNAEQTGQCLLKAAQNAEAHVRESDQQARASARQAVERRSGVEATLIELDHSTVQHVQSQNAHIAALVQQVKEDGLQRRVANMTAEQQCLQSFMKEQEKRSQQMQEKLLAGVHSLLDSFASTQRQMLNDACVAFQKQLEEHKIGLLHTETQVNAFVASSQTENDRFVVTNALVTEKSRQLLREDEQLATEEMSAHSTHQAGRLIQLKQELDHVKSSQLSSSTSVLEVFESGKKLLTNRTGIVDACIQQQTEVLSNLEASVLGEMARLREDFSGVQSKWSNELEAHRQELSTYRKAQEETSQRLREQIAQFRIVLAKESLTGTTPQRRIYQRPGDLPRTRDRTTILSDLRSPRSYYQSRAGSKSHSASTALASSNCGGHHAAIAESTLSPVNLQQSVFSKSTTPERTPPPQQSPPLLSQSMSPRCLAGTSTPTSACAPSVAPAAALSPRSYLPTLSQNVDAVAGHVKLPAERVSLLATERGTSVRSTSAPTTVASFPTASQLLPPERCVTPDPEADNAEKSFDSPSSYLTSPSGTFASTAQQSSHPSLPPSSSATVVASASPQPKDLADLFGVSLVAAPRTERHHIERSRSMAVNGVARTDKTSADGSLSEKRHLSLSGLSHHSVVASSTNAGLGAAAKENRQNANSLGARSLSRSGSGIKKTTRKPQTGSGIRAGSAQESSGAGGSGAGGSKLRRPSASSTTRVRRELV